MKSTSYQPINKPANTANPKDICRLRHGLNDDCLLERFQYLSVQDLIKQCKLNTYFYDLIATEIIAKKVIELGMMSHNHLELKLSTIESFQWFGKFLKKFVIEGIEFNQFLDTIVNYCRPARFTEVELEFNFDLAGVDLINRSMPFFSKLRKLRLSDVYSNGLYQQFLTKLSKDGTSLEILQLRKVDIVGGWLQNMQNLSELEIYLPKVIALDDLTSCYRANPKLITFRYEGHENISEAYNTLSKCCPQLTTFSDCHISVNASVEAKAVDHRYKFLSSLTKLDKVTLTSYSETGYELNDTLKIPTLVNISKLEVFSNHQRLMAKIKDRNEEVMRKRENIQGFFVHVKVIQISPTEMASSDDAVIIRINQVDIIKSSTHRVKGAPNQIFALLAISLAFILFSYLVLEFC